MSLSVLADSCELLAGTQEGSVYRLLLADLSASKVREMKCRNRPKRALLYCFIKPEINRSTPDRVSGRTHGRCSPRHRGGGWLVGLGL